MSGSKGGFSVDVSLKDNASATVDKLSGKFAGLSKKVEELGKKSAGVGEASNGLAQVTEKMKGFGDQTLESFRSMDRLVPAMGALTGAASLAGLTALISKFGEFGHSIEMMSYRLSIPVERLNALEQGARLAGASAGGLDRGMATLGDRLSGAHWGRDSDAVRLFRSLGVEFDTAAGGARNADDALGDVAEAVKKLPDPRTQARVVRELFGGEELLPFLRKGREGIAEYTAMVAKYGGTVTPEMAQRGEALQESVLHLSTAATGLGNAIADDLAPFVTGLNEGLASWIANNRDLIAQDIAGWVKGILTPLGELAKWFGDHPEIVGVLLGAKLGSKFGPVGALVGGAVGGITATFEANKSQQDALKARAAAQGFQPTEGKIPDFVNPTTHERLSWGDMSKRLGQDPYSGKLPPATPPAPTSSAVPRVGRALLATIGQSESGNDDSVIYGDRPGHGSITDFSHHPHIFRPITSGPLKGKDVSSASGYLQITGTTWDQENKTQHLPDFSHESQTAMGWHLAQQTYAQSRPGRDLEADLEDPSQRAFIGPALHGRWTSLPGGSEQGTTANRFASSLSANLGGEQTAQGGTVTVDVHLHNAPPGTMVVASAAGAVRVPPPRIDTALPGVH